MKLAFKFDDGRVVSHEVFERTFTVGRSESCRVTLDSEHFSREHCLIELIDGKVYVTDLGSKNGVYINHIRIPAKMKVNLDLKLPLYVGECFLTIDITQDLRDPDHLSLETHVRVSPDEVYQRIEAPRRIQARPRPVSAPRAQEKKFLDGKGLMIAALILLAVTAIHFTRTQMTSAGATSEKGK